MRVGFYVRVSTDGQSVEGQVLALRADAARRGWTDAALYDDSGWSGGRADRPALARLMQDAEAGALDVVMVAALDRLGRSLVHLIGTADALQRHKVALVSLREGLDFTTPAGRLQFQIIAALAEFERAMIRDRTMAGLAAARARGRCGGRRIERDYSDVEQMLASGESCANAARLTGLPETTIRRVKSRMDRQIFAGA